MSQVIQIIMVAPTYKDSIKR